MFLDIAPTEFLLIAAVAVVCIGPKDMPRALRTAGRWMGKMRRASQHLRSGFETMIREAEMEEMERKWREQNEAIMKAHPHSNFEPHAGTLGGEAPMLLPAEPGTHAGAATEPAPLPVAEKAAPAPVASLPGAGS